MIRAWQIDVRRRRIFWLGVVAALVFSLLALGPGVAEAGVIDVPPPGEGCLDSTAGAVGLHEGVADPAGGFSIDVPGPVVMALVEWGGIFEDDPATPELGIEITGPSGTNSDASLAPGFSAADPTILPRDPSTYGYATDITGLFGDGSAGSYAIDITAPGAPPPGVLNTWWGATVTVVYDTSPCSDVSQIIWKIGTDFYFGGDAAFEPTTDLIVYEFDEPLAQDTDVTLQTSHGGSDGDTDACRVSNIWTATGTGAAPAESDDLVDDEGVVNPTYGATEGVIDPFSPANQPCAPASVNAPVLGVTGGNVGNEWALIEMEIRIPAGSTWLALQLESPADNNGIDARPESGSWSGGGILIIKTAAPQEPDISLSKTVLDGAGGACPGVEGTDELVSGLGGAPVTYCFAVENTGDTDLFPVVLDDPDLGITDADMTLVSGDDTVPLVPGGMLVYSYESTIAADLLNTATVTGTPVEDGEPIPDTDPVTDTNDAEVQFQVFIATAAPLCDNDVPWLVYDIVATGFGATATITFAGSGQTATVTVPIGNDRVLWPGAEIDAAGVGTDWPGWDLDTGGKWFQNPANEFYWASQPDVTVTIEVNPTIGPIAAPYPPASPQCTAAPPEDPPEEELPNTGIDSEAIGLIGLVLLLGGGAAVVAERTIRRRRQQGA